MLTAIYKSPRKDQTYLYLKQRDDFKVVPEALLKTFGTPQLVTVLDLSRRAELAGAELAKVQAALIDQGYYLQLPPPPEDLLKTIGIGWRTTNRQNKEIKLIRFLLSFAVTTGLAFGVVGCSSATESGKTAVASQQQPSANRAGQSTANSAELPEKTAEGFALYVQGLKAEAQKRGYSEALIAEVFASLTFHPKVVVADKGQPEFVETLDTYLPKRVDAYRIKSAKAMYQKHAQELAAVSKKYGVPARFIVSLWGLESAFGKVTGRYSVPSSLATLAYDGRREQMFRKEFFIAMDILAEEHITLAKMKGSWAGAMGHTQFMPSAFMKYAQDGDGDGHKDIWTNSSDAMASIANYLKMEGWQSGQSWGRQVILPANFDYSLVIPKGSKDRAQWLQWWQRSERSLTDWQALGVTAVDGKPLPKSAMRAALVMPDDKDGRAYLAYANYQVLMHWNRSYYFVSSVGYLADAIVAAE